MTKRTYNDYNENEFYRAEKQNALGHWVPLVVFGHFIDCSTKENVLCNIRYYRRWKNYKTNLHMIPRGTKVRVVKITSKIKTHTTILKEKV